MSKVGKEYFKTEDFERHRAYACECNAPKFALECAVLWGYRKGRAEGQQNARADAEARRNKELRFVGYFLVGWTASAMVAGVLKSWGVFS